jgi:hypothetical protein
VHHFIHFVGVIAIDRPIFCRKRSRGVRHA